MKPLFDPVAFANRVHNKMLRYKLSFREVEQQSGVDHANIHRVVVTRTRTPSVETYLRLVRWLEQP